MKSYQKFILLFFVLLAVSLQSCKHLKCSSSKKSNYSITKRRSVNTGSVIKFIVFDKKTQEPLENAILQIKDTKIVEFTQRDGSIQFNIQPGRYKFKAFHIGVERTTKYINVTSGDSVIIRFELYIPSI